MRIQILYVIICQIIKSWQFFHLNKQLYIIYKMNYIDK